MSDQQERAWLADFFGDDELDPELAAYLQEDDDGVAHLRHPLVYSIFHVPMLNRNVNRQLAWKRERLAMYREERDLHSIIDAHERPYRVDALLELAAEVTDCEWWELVAYTWTDSENIRECAHAWEFILRTDRAQHQCMMRDDEREAFAALPKLIAVYQGCTDQRDDGLSWTTDRAKAEWFANRFASMEKAEPVVRAAFVDKTDVLAYLTRRNESEILVAPEHVREL